MVLLEYCFRMVIFEGKCDNFICIGSVNEIFILEKINFFYDLCVK